MRRSRGRRGGVGPEGIGGKMKQMKNGFVYLLCQGCLVSQANEKQLDSCQLSMTIRL